MNPHFFTAPFLHVFSCTAFGCNVGLSDVPGGIHAGAGVASAVVFVADASVSADF